MTLVSAVILAFVEAANSYQVKDAGRSRSGQARLLRLVIFKRGEGIRDGQDEIEAVLGQFVVPGGAVCLAFCNECTDFENRLSMHDFQELCRIWIAFP